MVIVEEKCGVAIARTWRRRTRGLGTRWSGGRRSRSRWLSRAYLGGEKRNRLRLAVIENLEVALAQACHRVAMPIAHHHAHQN
jgi:hypothetical protein